MGGELSLKEVQKRIRDSEISKELGVALQSGISLGKDDARKELEEKLKEWKREEHTILSHKLFFERMMKELAELSESWKLKTIPWEQVKQELENERLSTGSS